jgi:hypothetical protein
MDDKDQVKNTEHPLSLVQWTARAPCIEITWIVRLLAPDIKCKGGRRPTTNAHMIPSSSPLILLLHSSFLNAKQESLL